MPQINIGNQVINFPDAGSSPSWAPALIDFAVAVEQALLGIASPFDISPRVQTLTSDANTNLNIDQVIFPSGSVRGFAFNYAIYRTNAVTAVAEKGYVNGVFNTLTSVWDIQHEFNGPRQSDGSCYNTFTMSGDQMQLTTVAIGGSYDSTNSNISYAATTILVSNQ